MKDPVERSRGMETLMVEVLNKIKPTDLLRFDTPTVQRQLSDLFPLSDGNKQLVKPLEGLWKINHLRLTILTHWCCSSWSCHLPVVWFTSTSSSIHVLERIMRVFLSVLGQIQKFRHSDPSFGLCTLHCWILRNKRRHTGVREVLIESTMGELLLLFIMNR